MVIGDKWCATGFSAGPEPILIFINTLESGLVNLVFIFADDTKLLGEINSTDERYLLQQD